MQPKILEDILPPMAKPRFSCAANMLITYVNRARQLVRSGPGLSDFECPLIPSLSKGEINRFVGEIHKMHPGVEINVTTGDLGTAIYAMTIDATYQAPVPTRVDLATVGGDATHKRLWQACRDQADYVSGTDTNNHERPDCSSGCRYFIPLDGTTGMDWGVCSEPRSPRAGLLTFEHMGCPFFEVAPDESSDLPPAEAPVRKARAKKSAPTV